MNHTPKIIEDAVEEFRIQLPKPKKHYHTQVDFRDHIYLEEWLAQTLTHIHTQAKVDEREEVLREMEELIKSKATLKTYFGDEYCSVDGFLEALKEKHYETHI